METFKSAFGAFLVFVASAACSATIDIYETWKDQAFESAFQEFVAGNTYTLSQDFAITNSAGAVKETRMPKGGAVFDFSDGNHTIRTGTVRLYNDYKKPSTFSFKGGTWDVGCGDFKIGGWYNLSLNNTAYELDGMIITNIYNGTTLVDGYGTNVQFIAKGCTRYYGYKNYINLAPATIDGYGDGVSKLIEFSEGSKFYAGSSSVYDSYNTATLRAQNTTIRFTGEGTVATGTEAGGAGNCDFYLGYRAPCYRLEVTDGAIFDFRFFHVGGFYNSNNGSLTGEYGCSNTVYVAGGGKIRVAYGLSIGQVPGADYNTFVVDDGGSYSNNMNAPISIGTRSSFNSFIITNGTIYAQAIQIGQKAGTSNNLFRVSGADSKLNLNVSQLTFFASGTGNTLELCDGFHYGTDSTEWYFSGNVYASTGNVFRVESGAAITGRYVRVASSDYSTNNLFHVGSDASVTSGEITMANVKTCGNTLCISNGTVNFTASYGFNCGGTGNVVRVQGDSSRVRFVGDGDSSSGIALLRNGVELQFDLTGLSAGYAEPVFYSKQFQMPDTAKLTFKGVEEVSQRLTSTAYFPLARVTATQSTMEYTIAESVLEAARASLPDRAKLYLDNNGQDLVLRVRPPAKGYTFRVR